MTIIPYTNNVFNRSQNKDFSQSLNTMTHFQQSYNNEFVQSLINDIDVYISSIMYDVDVIQKTSAYINNIIQKYYTYLNKDMLQYIAQLDNKYNKILPQNYIQNIFAQYLCDNVMITG